MVLVSPPSARSQAPSPEAVLTLLKPVTWFAPMWAFMCGVVSSGQSIFATWPLALAGAVLAGPLLCATSQAANDWFDRHVDAINEPGRPIPSGRIPGRWGLWIALIWSGLSLVMAAFLGVWVFCAALLGLASAWGYSAPPLRWKLSGWWGPAAVAVSYEGLAWFTGAAVVLQSFPDGRIILLAVLYSVGAHGIMTLNDFKSVEGDRVMGVRSLPVQLGAPTAARLACAIMVAPQLIVVWLWFLWGQPFAALGVALAVALQIVFAQRLLRDPRRFAPWFNATGVLVYVAGMLISAIAVGSIVGAKA